MEKKKNERSLKDFKITELPDRKKKQVEKN
jgi:hypothetical protein